MPHHTPSNVPENVGPTISTDGESTLHVASECQALFRIIDPHERRAASFQRVDSTVFHVPAFPTLDAIDPAVKLYEKRDALDADLVETLLCLDWKMNLLIKILSPIPDETRYPYRAVITTMSLQHLTIKTSQRLAVATALELHFVLPVLPFREMFLQGEVTGLSDTPKEYDLAVIPTNLNEVDREHLIRYFVKRQFQLKREQKREERLKNASPAQSGISP